MGLMSIGPRLTLVGWQEVGGTGELGLYYNVAIYFERRMAANDQVSRGWSEARGILSEG